MAEIEFPPLGDFTEPKRIFSQKISFNIHYKFFLYVNVGHAEFYKHCSFPITDSK